MRKVLLGLMVMGLLPASAHAAEGAGLPVKGEAPDAPQLSHIKPGHVLARVDQLGRHVDDLRWLMGRRRADHRVLHVANAQPRQVYFQATWLFRKADLLATERLGQSRALPAAPPARQIRPADVHQVIVLAQEQVLAVRRALGVPRAYRAEPVRIEATPSDVYMRVLAVGRQLDALSLTTPDTRDSLRAVDAVRSELERLLKKVGAPPFAPKEETLGQGHVPGDVFFRLVNCARLLFRAMDVADLPIMEVHSLPTTWIDENDVINAATLLLGELAYLNGSQPMDSASKSEPEGEEASLLVFPSHVLRQVGALEQMLLHLLSWVEQHPDRLGREA